MGLDKQYYDQISLELERQGVTFHSLETELLDHLLCDIECHMDRGMSFEQAWSSIKQQIPKNHFKIIQNETMELINQKMKPVRIAGIFTLALLVVATVFKSLHLPGAALLLFSFLVSASITLIVGSNRTIYTHPSHKGKYAIVGVTFAVVVLIVGLCFKILHLPGAGELLYASVVSMGVLFPALAVYFYAQGAKAKQHMAISTIEEYQWAIERTAMILLAFGLVFNYSDLLFGYAMGLGVFFFMFAIMITGIYVYAMTWKHYVETGERKISDTLLLIFSSIAFTMFVIPIVGQDIPYVLRHYLAYLPGAIFSLIVWAKYAIVDRSRSTLVPAAVSTALLFYPLLRIGIKLQWFEGWLASLTTDPVFILGFLVVLIGLFFGYRKHMVFRLLILLTIASHMIPNI